MSAETVGIFVGKWIWSVIVPYLVFLKITDKKKLDNTYTKLETDKLIDGVKEKLDLKHTALVDKCDTLITLMKTDIIENKKQRQDNNDLLHEIKIDVVLVKSKFDDIKEDVQELKSDVNTLQHRNPN